MQITPMGDSAMLAEVGTTADDATLDRVLAVARVLAAALLPGVTDIVPAFTTVTVHYDLTRIPAGPGAPVARVAEWLRLTAATAKPAKRASGHEVEVPVCYGGDFGPDLAAVARRAGVSEMEVVKLHTGVRYRVAAVGFAPGFPYLLGLPTQLQMPRRASPRVSVPAGSVGIGGAQTGVYPNTTPGGWQLIGRTPLQFFRPEAKPPALLYPGDFVRFRAIPPELWPEETKVKKEEGTGAKEIVTVEIVQAGGHTTIQDLGRPGWQRVGVTPGGVMDRQAARVANILLGNPEDAPLLESALTGPELRFHADTWIAVTGAEFKGVPGWRPLHLAAGTRLSLAELVRGAHVYVAVAGGFTVPSVLGGAGTDLRAGFGGWRGRALRAGDRLATGTPGRAGGVPRRDWAAAREFWTPGGREITVRYVRGRRWAGFDEAARTAFKSTAWKVRPQSDRMGLRLAGPALTSQLPGEMVSEGVVFGSVQVPPNGQPIVLLADRQTLGGYLKIGHVIAVDLPQLAQVRPGDTVRFAEIPVAAAQMLALELEKSLALLRMGVEARLQG